MRLANLYLDANQETDMAFIQEWVHAFALLENQVCANAWHTQNIVLCREKMVSYSLFMLLWRKIKEVFPNAYLTGDFVLFLLGHIRTFYSVDIRVPDEYVGPQLSVKISELMRYVDRNLRAAPEAVTYDGFNDTCDLIRIKAGPVLRYLNVFVPIPPYVEKCANLSALGKVMIRNLRSFTLDLCKVAILDILHYHNDTDIKSIDVKMCQICLTKAIPLNLVNRSSLTDELDLVKYRRILNRETIHQPCKLTLECYKICKDMLIKLKNIRECYRICKDMHDALERLRMSNGVQTKVKIE